MKAMEKELKSLEDGKDEFLTDCKIRNLSEDTIHNYDECFEYFINFEKVNVRQDIKKEM